MLLTLPFSGLPLVFCRSLKIIYDLALLIAFRHNRPPAPHIPRLKKIIFASPVALRPPARNR
jgi:hypothetical protein